VRKKERSARTRRLWALVLVRKQQSIAWDSQRNCSRSPATLFLAFLELFSVFFPAKTFRGVLIPPTGSFVAVCFVRAMMMAMMKRENA
jgi:hypothetical protein